MAGDCQLRRDPGVVCSDWFGENRPHSSVALLLTATKYHNSKISSTIKKSTKAVTETARSAGGQCSKRQDLGNASNATMVRISQGITRKQVRSLREVLDKDDKGSLTSHSVSPNDGTEPQPLAARSRLQPPG